MESAEHPRPQSAFPRELAVGMAIGGVILAAVFAAHLIGARETPRGQLPLARINDRLSPLAERFNVARDSTRFVILLSPT